MGDVGASSDRPERGHALRIEQGSGAMPETHLLYGRRASSHKRVEDELAGIGKALDCRRSTRW
jgi:hypothetical protein